MNVLVTGGLGYIGSHTCVELVSAGHRVIILDNLANSSVLVLERIQEITGVTPVFVEGDIRDTELVVETLAQHDVSAVIHFAGLKAVGEGEEMPVEYWDVNVGGTNSLLRAMKDADCHQIVFSSSATVYGEKAAVPYVETSSLGPSNVYGRTKYVTELMLRDTSCGKGFSPAVALLRYFNPIGAHSSGRIGESPRGVPNNLMPYISQVAVGKREKLSIFGGDYSTRDGTGVRDYIHVVDLAIGHLKALDYLAENVGCHVFNLGSGAGHSVLEMVRAFEKQTGVRVPYEIVDRRAGDLPEFYADPALAESLLNWRVERDLNTMIADTWRWQSNNPEGYV